MKTLQELMEASNNPVSVTEVSQQLKRAVESQFRQVWVRGEISGLKKHTSGHTYFALKDQESVLDAVAWRGTSMPSPLSDGAEVTVRGRITTYGARSKYQIVIEHMEASGQGALWQKFLELKQKLEAEGLFSKPKKKIPTFPKSIGVITSETGAVLQDILHRLEERYPCHVLLLPVLVQGVGSAEQVAGAIEYFQSLSSPPDTLIVARGGGSLADLWTFNEEIVVRAAAASTIPLISAIGHETDTTLIDFVSDLRAPTPTAAAEAATPVISQVLAYLAQQQDRLNRVWSHKFNTSVLQLKALANQLVHPRARLDQANLRLDDYSERLDRAIKSLYDRTKSQFDYMANRLDQSSYDRTLAKGFCFVQSDAGEVVSTADKFIQLEGKNAYAVFADAKLTFKPQDITKSSS